MNDNLFPNHPKKTPLIHLLVPKGCGIKSYVWLSMLTKYN